MFRLPSIPSLCLPLRRCGKPCSKLICETLSIYISHHSSPFFPTRSVIKAQPSLVGLPRVGCLSITSNPASLIQITKDHRLRAIILAKSPHSVLCSLCPRPVRAKRESLEQGLLHAKGSAFWCLVPCMKMIAHLVLPLAGNLACGVTGVLEWDVQGAESNQGAILNTAEMRQAKG